MAATYLGRLLLVLGLWPGFTFAEEAPPNQPAELRLEGMQVELRYHGETIFSARIKNAEALRAARPAVVRRGEAVDQVVVWTAMGREPLEIEGRVAASVQAFPCESDRPLRGLPIVRHASGPSRSRLNQAVYDRKWDWALSVDDQPHTVVRVVPDGASTSSRFFRLEARGNEIVLRFRPRFYQKHRGLALFEPWTYDVWTKPVVGWCSWFAFLDTVTEGDIKRTADVLSEVLRPFGYEYLQIDDGYQRGTGRPELWLNANEKFPGGLEALAAYIRGKGLRPGLWTNATFSQSDFAQEHADWFVHDEAGAGRPWQLDRPSPGRLRARGHRRPRPPPLPRAAGDGLGVLQARRPSPPPLRGIQRLPRPFRPQGDRARRRFPALRGRRPGGDRKRSLPPRLLGSAAGAGGTRGRLPPGHRRLLLRGPRPVQLVQQRGLEERPRSRRAQRGRSLALDPRDLAHRLDAPAHRQTGEVPDAAGRSGQADGARPRHRARPALRRGRVAFVGALAGGRRVQRTRSQAVRRQPHDPRASLRVGDQPPLRVVDGAGAYGRGV